MSAQDEEDTESPVLKVSEWKDFREGEEFPDSTNFIRALNRPLRTPTGPQDQFVALWYHHGRPLMGRVWAENRRIRASFVDNDREYSGQTVAQLQILVEMPSPTTGFTYDWRMFKSVAKVGHKEWHPVHLSSIAPCVLLVGNYEILGSANLKDESAQTCINGHHVRFVGRDIQNFPILCRKVCSDTMEI